MSGVSVDLHDSFAVSMTLTLPVLFAMQPVITPPAPGIAAYATAPPIIRMSAAPMTIIARLCRIFMVFSSDGWATREGTLDGLPEEGSLPMKLLTREQMRLWPRLT